MKYFLFPFLFLVITNSLFSQRTIEQGRQWNVFDSKFFSPNTCTIQYAFLNDTIINSVEYLELFSRRDTVSSTNFTSRRQFLREDSLNRIYIREFDNERILYDFNLIEGDTFFIGTINSGCELIVHQVDTVQILNGDLRKRIRLINIAETNPSQPIFGFNDWIQGIGSTFALTEYGRSCFTDFSLSLLCFYENDEILFANPINENLDCFISPVAEIGSNNAIDISPNPAKNLITIESQAEVIEVNIFSLSGELALTSKLSAVSINMLPKGLYIVQVETRDGIQTEKLIVL